MVRCRIITAGNYADWEGSGTNRKARHHDPDDVILFPEFYAEFLLNQGMIEILPSTDILRTEEISLDESAEMDKSLGIFEDVVPRASEGAVELAAANGVNLKNVLGSGSEGRILLADVRAHIGSGVS